MDAFGADYMREIGSLLEMDQLETLSIPNTQIGYSIGVLFWLVVKINEWAVFRLFWQAEDA